MQFKGVLPYRFCYLALRQLSGQTTKATGSPSKLVEICSSKIGKNPVANHESAFKVSPTCSDLIKTLPNPHKVSHNCARKLENLSEPTRPVSTYTGIKSGSKKTFDATGSKSENETNSINGENLSEIKLQTQGSYDISRTAIILMAMEGITFTKKDKHVNKKYTDYSPEILPHLTAVNLHKENREESQSNINLLEENKKNTENGANVNFGVKKIVDTLPVISKKDITGAVPQNIICKKSSYGSNTLTPLKPINWAFIKSQKSKSLPFQNYPFSKCGAICESVPQSCRIEKIEVNSTKRLKDVVPNVQEKFEGKMCTFKSREGDSDKLTDVPGPSRNVVLIPDNEVFKGISKKSVYKNPEYFCYHKYSFNDALIEQISYHMPQPSNRPKRSESTKSDT